MPKYTMVREILEWIEIEAPDIETAENISEETPIEQWHREIKSVYGREESTMYSINDPNASWRLPK